MSLHGLTKIISGGQTGVDRAALDTAMFLDIPHGGWCPQGRRAEDGRIPSTYKLSETEQRDYSVRTEKNVIDSDGTLILFRDNLTGGTELTYRLARKHRRPCLCLDLEREGFAECLSMNSICEWIAAHNIGVLNVAGPRESTSPGIGRQAETFLVNALRSDRNRVLMDELPMDDS